VPIALITQKRGSIGSTSSEVAQLRGVRYADMLEPSHNETINEGIMKSLTGQDPIQARELFMPSITFKPAFSLVVCANSYLNVRSNDNSNDKVHFQIQGGGRGRGRLSVCNRP
jgi:hypothetical protein